VISVRAVGSLGEMLGEGGFKIEADSISLAELLTKVAEARDFRVDFTNIIVVVNGVKTSGVLEDVMVSSGDEVTLIPVVHGG